MPAVTHGNIFEYGISDTSIAAGVVISKDITKAFRSVTESKDSNGRTVGVRMDDWAETGTLTVQLASGSVIPAAGSTFALKDLSGSSATFIITEVGRSESNSDNVRITYNIRNDQEF